MKQETLEEAANNYANQKGDIPTTELEDAIFKQGFLDGSKWQEKMVYSEEEVIEIIKLSCEEGMLIQRTINDKVKIPYMRIKDFTIKILEQFKKK
jgi:hypothetical protein